MAAGGLRDTHMLLMPFILIWAFCCDTEVCWRPTEETGIRFESEISSSHSRQDGCEQCLEKGRLTGARNLLLKLEASQPKAVDSTEELPRSTWFASLLLWKCNLLTDAVQLARDLLVGDTGLRYR